MRILLFEYSNNPNIRGNTGVDQENYCDGSYPYSHMSYERIRVISTLNFIRRLYQFMTRSVVVLHACLI